MKYLLLLLALTSCSHITTVHEEIKPAYVYVHPPKFKVGECVAYFFVSEIENGNTGRVYMYPKVHIVEMKEEIVDIKDGRYIIKDSHFGTGYEYQDTREVENFDQSHAALNCDGKYEDGH